jgi:hypothetical protein
VTGPSLECDCSHKAAIERYTRHPSGDPHIRNGMQNTAPNRNDSSKNASRFGRLSKGERYHNPGEWVAAKTDTRESGSPGHTLDPGGLGADKLELRDALDSYPTAGVMSRTQVTK